MPSGKLSLAYSGTAQRGGRSAALAASRIQAAYRRKYSRPAPKAIQKKYAKIPTGSTYKLSKPMKALVQSVVDANRPDHWGMVLAGQSLCRYGADAASGASLIPLIPGIEQAAYDRGTVLADIQSDNLNSREGKSIKLKSIKGRLTVLLHPNTLPGPNPAQGDLTSSIYIRILVLSAKNRPTFKQVTDDWIGFLLPNLFLDQNTKPMTWQGHPELVAQPVNRTLFTVHSDKTVLLSRGALIEDTVGQWENARMMSHMPSMIHHFPINVKCKGKILQYLDSKAIYPTNFAPFIVPLYCTATTADTTQMQSILMKHGSFKMTFED